ncbi:MAG: cation diffusion facilitator family transporter [candidate division Zixibacteria bacterium]|nr:cation diffusion facilitator family transporter [candidate division Zixibacteria bacterium]
MNKQNTLAIGKESSLGDIGAGLRATVVGSVVNVVLVVFKLWAGILSGSQALIADGIHSLSDLFSDFVVILGLKWGRRHEDADHPYGHARIETISSMIVGMLLVGVAVGIAYSGLQSIYHHEPSSPSLFAVIAAATSIILKEGLYWYTIIIGRRLRSLALIGNAWHHRSDALTSVAVLFGVGATFVNPDWSLADSYAALVVTFFVAKIGLQLVWSAFKELSDTAPDREVLIQLTECAEQIDGIQQVHDMRARLSGSQIFVELHIVVDPDLTVRAGHAIAHNVKKRLLEEFSDVTRVIIHTDPELKTDI